MTINALDITVRAEGGVLKPVIISRTLVAEPGSYNLSGSSAVTSVSGTGLAPIIVQPPNAEITLGNTFTYSPSLSQGTDVLWAREFGPDALDVDPENGDITWDSSVLPRGQGIKVGLSCSNEFGEADTAWFIIHVDNTGSSQLLELGVGGIATTLNAASAQMSPGDTLAIPAGSYWASTTGNDSYENTWCDSGTASLVAGTSSQMTTLMSFGQGDGQVVIDGSPHDGIQRQTDAGFEMIAASTAVRDWMKFSGMEWKGSERQSIDHDGDNCIFELCGAADCSYAIQANTFAEADPGAASVAGGYLSGTNVSWENSYAYGEWRYGLQRGLQVTGCLTHRNIVRPDEYRGDQPRGGIIHYGCEDVGAYNNFVVDADREDLVPFYKNYAGAFACPATNVEGYPTNLDFDANMTVNSQLSWGLIDSTESVVTFNNKNAVGVDISDAVAPQTQNSGSMGIRSDHAMLIDQAAFYRTYSYDGGSTLGAVRADNSMTVQNSIFHQIGWDDNSQQTVNVGDILENSTADLNNSLVYDQGGGINTTGGSTTGLVTYSALENGWDYPPRVEEGSALSSLGIGPDFTNFKSPSNVIPGDTGWQTETSVWPWPHPGERTIAARMATYSASNLPVRNAPNNPVDFTGSIAGDRGFCANNESFSEYIWGYFGRTVPPLRVGAKLTGTNEITFRVGKYRSWRGDSITKFNVYLSTNQNTPVLTFTGLKGVLNGAASGINTYYIRAVDPTQISAFDANETGESGNSRALTVDNPIPSFLVENLTLNGSQGSFSGIGGNAGSDVAWIEDHNRIMVCENSAGELHEYADTNLNSRIRTITLNDSAYDDTEGVVWMGNNEICVCSEDGGDYILRIYDYVLGSSNVTWFPKQILEIAPPSGPNNSGAEGVCYDKANEIFYVVGEGQQDGANRRFFRVERPTNTTTDYDYTDPELVVTEPWNAQTRLVEQGYPSSGLSFDFSAVEFHPPTGHCLILSDRGDEIIQVDVTDGTVISNYLIGSTSPQWEGITFTDTNYNLMITAESAIYQYLDS